MRATFSLGSVSSAPRWRALACSDPLAVLVDLDGTLIGFAASPEYAVLDRPLLRVVPEPRRP